MKKLFIPAGAERIIEKLKTNGHEAYIVGGCVRDALLGKAPYDYDITTSALPEEIKSIFEKTVDTGIAHGTVTVICDGVPYEVTTFRIDGEYQDSRHPVSVSFTKKVELDLARRDFTVNALCYNHESGIIDAFGGISDLENKIIRAVRDPELRFSEDALRVFRAIRFAAVLGFNIEDKTKRAIREYKTSLKNISVERIYIEWKKLLSGKWAYTVIEEYLDVITECIPELNGIKLPERAKFDALTAEERQILLFALAGDSKVYENAMCRLRVDNKTKDLGITVIDNLTLSDGMTESELRLYLCNVADEAALTAARIAFAMGICSESVYERLKHLIEADTPRSIADLKIDGRDLIELGLRGEQIGRMLKELLTLVAMGKIENQKHKLKEYAASARK